MTAHVATGKRQTANGTGSAPLQSMVSVIVPVYNGERCVESAIASALNQTHRSLEVLVIDDGSTDGTWNRLEAVIDPRVRVFRQANSGASAARNLGLANAAGDYIAFLDADDLWLPRKLERELDAFAGRGYAAGIAYSWYYCVDEEGMLTRPSPAVRYSGDVLERLLGASPFIIPSASLFSREIFETIGTFDTARRYHEDFAYVLRACRRYPAFPTLHYTALYQQSMTGKARRVMHDYDAAVTASQSIADDLAGVLTESEATRLAQNLRKELYYRFLMYGFNASAARLLETIPTSSLPGGVKGWLGWVFAKTKLNLMMPTRLLVATATKMLGRHFWNRFLKSEGVHNAFNEARIAHGS